MPIFIWRFFLNKHCLCVCRWHSTIFEFSFFYSIQSKFFRSNFCCFLSLSLPHLIWRVNVFFPFFFINLSWPCLLFYVDKNELFLFFLIIINNEKPNVRAFAFNHHHRFYSNHHHHHHHFKSIHFWIREKNKLKTNNLIDFVSKNKQS